jgi:hypothetical protein
VSIAKYMEASPNKPTPGNAGWALQSRFHSERHWPGVPESERSGKVRITMTTVRDYGHHSRGFASLRLCVSALFRRATEVPYRFATGFVSAPSRFRALGRFRSPNQAAPAKPAGASLFDSQPFERGLAEPRR